MSVLKFENLSKFFKKEGFFFCFVLLFWCWGGFFGVYFPFLISPNLKYYAGTQMYLC